MLVEELVYNLSRYNSLFEANLEKINWYIKIGDMRIVLDGYITRLPGPPFFFAPKSFPGDQYAYTKAPAAVDVASVTKVREALLGNTKLDYVLSGHSHWDHSWDTPTWAKQAGGVMIGVADNGPGLPEDKLEEVTKPFVRLDSARPRDTVGFGLGLAIVARAVELEGGTLTLRNRPVGGLSAEIVLRRL